ncbi:MAG: hypothetical protein HeimC2_39440 [Candidatus Heimdallarchaeota archaeon LC_2]|nr:MAG: hypothetical protein HeimC2_39440 [Candidatus Heimdallarchaeota archaeon LC_2]
MITTVEEALAFIRDQKIVTLSMTKTFPSLINEIVDEPIEGSWWGHPKGNEIWIISEGVKDSVDILTTKMLYGKVTFIYKSLWPSLYKIVTDSNWRERRITKLNTLGRKILNELQIKQKIRFDQLNLEGEAGKNQKKVLMKVRHKLEASLLIHSEQLHTTKGYHITQIKLWEEWATDKVKQISATLKFKDAMSQIAKFCKDTELEFFE